MQVIPAENQLLGSLSKDKWERIGTYRRSGVLVPLFSVYSRKSTGIGEFPDLKLVVDWAKLTGNSIIQLLPMNEVGGTYCPYDAVSAFALEPAYISLNHIPLDRNTEVEINNLKIIFPCGQGHLDYGIKKEKMRILWLSYCAWDHADSLEFKRFKEKNAYWLIDFALFKVLKGYHNGLPWYEWEEPFKHRKGVALENFSIEHQRELDFQAWVQWIAFRQFAEAKEYARGQGILIKGDLPILVSRDSADVWQHASFFKLDYASGAPPDLYCAKGQRWGMPTYQWRTIEEDGFRYIKEKFAFAQNFYDILRIDHVVGIFRIWSIPYNDPLENQGLNGFFDPKDKSAWGVHGLKILSVMNNATTMLLCAEDLGVIPQVCTDTLKELGIPGNDVQRWVKDWKTAHDFFTPQEFRESSVAMLSTHDTTNWPAWWENEAGTIDEGLFIRKCTDNRQIPFEVVRDKLFDPLGSRHGRLRWRNEVASVDQLVVILGKRKEEVADFIELYENSYREKEKLWRHLGFSGPMREASDRRIIREALRISLQAKAIFCINTVIDWLYLADLFVGDTYQYRINTPGTTNDKNWSLALPIPLEDLLRHKVNKEIRGLLVSSQRI